MTEESTRPAFEPDGGFSDTQIVEDQSQAVDSTIIARFEFQAGKGNDGTKILMVEWEEDDKTRSLKGQWQVSWEGKQTVLPAGDQLRETHRLYFLLPQGATIPPRITLTYQVASGEKITFEARPLPAIYPPELGASGRSAGKRGVLHTIWAKQRLAVLQGEIEREELDNVAGIGLEMALQEKTWIQKEFGVGPRPSISTLPSAVEPASPTSPRTPGGGRFLEKMKGLKVATDARGWNSKPNSPQVSSIGSRESHALSPQAADVAISSFAAIHGGQRASPKPFPRAIASTQPPASLLAAQEAFSQGPGAISIAGALSGLPTNDQKSEVDEEDDDELFAVALSPRSPDDPRSPFSLESTDKSLIAATSNPA